jgi:hypothetical protein
MVFNFVRRITFTMAALEAATPRGAQRHSKES